MEEDQSHASILGIYDRAILVGIWQRKAVHKVSQ